MHASARTSVGVAYLLLEVVTGSSSASTVRLYSSVVERQSCKLKVLGSIPSGGFFASGQ